MMGLSDRVSAIRQRIAAAAARSGRAADAVRLIAVTKQQGPDALPALAACGVMDFGENRLDHLDLMLQAARPGQHAHFIGRIQGRQLAKLPPGVRCLHSLADPDHVGRLGRALDAADRRIEVFVQANTCGDPAKAGVAPGELPRMLDLVRAQPRIDLVGLMTMAEHPEGAADALDRARRGFAALRSLALAHGLPRLSMGMSGDFETAIAEGATDVRIGTVLFADA